MRAILPLRFESIQTLRETANSSTFVATDHVLGRNNVVIKAIRKGAFTDDRSSLVDIFTWYRGLQHAHIAGILDAGLTPKGDLFYIRDFAPPTQLFSTRDTDLLNVLLGAVDFLHSMGRTHGSIKPSNVLASSKSVQLADPWIPQPRREALSEEDIRFSAPEVLKGHPHTIESDCYSVGALLYRFFSGRDLFDDADLESLKARYIWASPRPLTSISYVSRSIADIVESLIHKDPSLRRAAFEALKNELNLHSVAAMRSPALGRTVPLERGEQFLCEKVDRLRVLVVEAPAGFGKTRYVEELRYRTALRVPNLAFSVCPTVGPSPEATVARWLLSVFERHCSSYEDSSVRRLQAFVDDNLKLVAGYSPERMAHDLVDVLSSIAQKTPLILAVEDIDRANGKVGRLIASIVERATRLQLCFVITSRSGGFAPKLLQTLKDYVGSGLEHVSLGHLQAADCESIASFLERDEDRRIAAVTKSGGNPLFLEAYCKHQKPGTPQLVRSTISKLVAKLPKESRRVAEVMSLFEEPVSFNVLQQISGLESQDLEGHLAYLRTLGLCDESIVIRHNDTRTSMQSRIPQGRRTALHARCYEHLKDSGFHKNNLASHAYHGALVEEASRLYLELAEEAMESRSLTSAAQFYELVGQCRKRSSAPPAQTIKEAVSLARCQGYAGNSTAARKTLRHLLSIQAVLDDPELLSSVYSALASQFIEPSNTERIRLLNLAMGCLPTNSQIRIYSQISLAQALLRDGRLEEVETVLRFNENPAGDIGRAALAAIRAMTLGARGRFRDAVESLVQHGVEDGLIPSAWSTNVAVLYEQLGDIRKARKIQADGLHQATSPAMEIVCLSNLGSMETKLGNVRAAQILFEKAIAKMERMRRGATAVFPQGVWYSDAALHWIERGNYRQAIHCIDRFDIGSTYHWESFQLYLAQCELLLALGQLESAGLILERTLALGSIGGYLDVERILVQYRLETPTEHLCDELQRALDTAKQLETRYQQCRVLIALAEILLLRGKLSDARLAANEALRLAEERGYRLLAARAYLRRGLAAQTEAQKQADLSQCLQDTSDMNLFPLLAECLFHFGAWRYASGDYPSARDYLFKSVSITSQIAEGLDSVRRKSYFSVPLRQDAKRLLQEATIRTRQFMSVLKEPLRRDDLLLGGVYCLTTALASASDLKSIVSILNSSLRQCIPHSGVIISEDGNELILQPLTERLEEKVRQSAINVFRKGNDRIYFTSLGNGDARGLSAWVPIPCRTLRSGIYIECSGDGAALDEQEIRFLTISASITGAAMDRKGSQRPQPTPAPPSEFSGIVGISESVKKVHIDIEVAASNSATVLIEGESGVGKELVAQAIHSRSFRAKAPFVPVDCGALPEGLIEAELFGTRKGSFTGAAEDRRGLFEEADHGTIFLDEIGNASLSFQTKLLRVLQEREIRRVGDTRGKRIDVRVIAATNCNLGQLVEEGRFRQDLLFRLKVLHVQLPPLRERKQDIPLLVGAFLSRLNALNQTNRRLRAEAMEDLLTHEYPGNVRELQNVIEQAFYRSNGDMIGEIALHKQGATGVEDSDETQGWFRELTEGRRNFWSAVRDRYKRRDISRERVLALVDRGLRSTQGNYKAVASMFNIKDSDYRRFMDFLRRNDCLLDFRPYRTMDNRS
jgi:DNA-binding NtrC family response regulator/tetratricopeptide (TPR) repeat protein